MEPRIPKESPAFDADNRWTRTWIMYFESLYGLSVEESVQEAKDAIAAANPLKEKGDLMTFSKAVVRLGVGSDGEVLTADSTQPEGIKWAAGGSGGGGGGTVTHTTGPLTADQPVFGAGTDDIKVGTKSGNTNKLATVSGSWTSGHVLVADASGNVVDGGPPGGAGSPAYISSMFAGPDTTRTISGATHGYTTAALLVAVYDNAAPRNAIEAGWTVNASTYDVVVTFGTAQSNYYVVINGATGPQGPAGPAGGVTSVALTMPAEFSVSGSPVTTSGTLAVSKATQSANTVFAGPTTGSAAAPTFRAVVPADLPLASSSAFGAVKVDGTTITASSGVISAAGGGGGTWANLSYNNSWTDFGSGIQTGQYLIDSASRVWLRGSIKPGTTTVNTTMFTLPSGFRPAATRVLYYITMNGSSGNSPGQISVYSDGTVKFENIQAGTVSLINLEGVSFSIL